MADYTTTIVSPQKCQLGEGPFWDERTQNLIFVDIMGQDIHRLTPCSGAYTKMHAGTTISFAIPRSKSPEQLVIGGGRIIQSLDFSNISIQNIVEVDKKFPENRFNDAKCDSKGRLWAGTMGKEKPQAGTVEVEQAALYTLESNKKLTKKLDKVSLSNGMDWTADNKIMYYIDSHLKTVDAFDFDLSKGDISNRRTVIDFNLAKNTSLGIPDGMTLDINGKLWVACYGGSSVVRFDPETGKQLQAIKLPVTKVTSCCFGGEDYQDLYVTTANFGLNAEQARGQPQAGHVYRISELNVHGLPAHTFAF